MFKHRADLIATTNLNAAGAAWGLGVRRRNLKKPFSYLNLVYCLLFSRSLILSNVLFNFAFPNLVVPNLI